MSDGSGLGLCLKWNGGAISGSGWQWRCMRMRGHEGGCSRLSDSPAPKTDEIHKPQHYRVPVICEYDDDGQAVEGLVTVECRELARALALPFSLANVLKYLWRAGRKTPDKLKDLRKARAYLDWEIAALEREESGKGVP